MTPKDLYLKYRGRRAREDKEHSMVRNDPCEGIVVGYFLKMDYDEDEEYPLIIALTNESSGAWYDIEPDEGDIVVDNQNNQKGYQYVRICDIMFKFGR